MPGLVGLISRMAPEAAERQLAVMVRVLGHESFYTHGTWVDRAHGVYVGWTAHEGSFSDAMPVQDARGDVVLLFSGEEYSDRRASDPAAAPRDGHPLSYLVGAYEGDRAFPASLNGRFHGLVHDRRIGSTRLFNDRYGMHRLYYYETGDAFYFAVEAKALLAVHPELRQLDPAALGEYLNYGCVLENRTLFEGMHVLPPASAWTFRAGALESRSAYFTPREWEEQAPAGPEDHHENVRSTFSRIVPRYLNGRQRVGVSLTGGLDTRLVMAWQSCPPGSLRCYTYSGPYRRSRDVVVARRVAEECGQPYEVVALGSAFFSRFAAYAERSVYLADGCVDVTRAPDLFLSERARTIAPVRLTGLYGDELLRPAIRAFKPNVPPPDVFVPEFLQHVHEAKHTYERALRCHPLSFSAFRQAPWHHHGILALEQTQLTVRTPFLDNDFVSVLFRAPGSAMANNALRVRLIGDGNPRLQRIPTDRGFAGAGGRLANYAVRQFHHFTFKAEYAYDYGMPQWLAAVDHLLSPFRLERLFLGRHKPYHYRVWYRGELREYVREMLLDRRTLSRPYLVPHAVEELVDAHLAGWKNHTTTIHKLLSLELLNRLFVDRA